MTSEEISRMVGCSAATVSRALNNTGVVAPKTREAILRALRDTSHLPQRSGRRQPGAAKRGQVGNLVHIIHHRHSPTEKVSLGAGGLNIGPLHAVSETELSGRSLQRSSSFYRPMIDGAITELEHWGYKAVVQSNTDLQDPEFVADINASGKAGVLLIGEYTPSMKSLVDLCRHPLVLADIICDEAHDVVTIDNLTGITKAFDHLYELGHRRIGFVGRCDENFAYAERFVAFKMKMAEAGLPIRPDWIYEGYSYIETATEGMKKMLSLPDRPKALLCSNDCVAMGVLRAADALGIAVPGDLSVVGFDDMEAASLVTPPLTTIHVPVTEIGHQAIRLLMIQIMSEVRTKHRGCRVRLVPELIVRHTTARCETVA